MQQDLATVFSTTVEPVRQACQKAQPAFHQYLPSEASASHRLRFE